MQNNTQYIEEDKIDLRELFSVLKRRRKMIWGVTSLLTLLAVIYAFFIVKPVYEVKTMIEVGRCDRPSTPRGLDGAGDHTAMAGRAVTAGEGLVGNLLDRPSRHDSVREAHTAVSDGCGPSRVTSHLERSGPMLSKSWMRDKHSRRQLEVSSKWN